MSHSAWESRIAAQRQAQDRIGSDFFFALDKIFSPQDRENIRREDGPAKVSALERCAVSAASKHDKDAIPGDDVLRVPGEGREIRSGKAHS